MDTINIKCDNCGDKCDETYTIKWPGLDAGIQYEEVCIHCKLAFSDWRSTKGYDKTIFKRRYDNEL